ncbi:hypothetical protein GOV03_00530 [Candidatus Woesearchaeota archaeon]|nr:hypothetical protein [Candidatus Woesearchaeota archaeon]
MLRDVYIQENGKIKLVSMDCSSIDLHCHSKYSNSFIPHKVTRFLGVRECYTPIKKISSILEKRGREYQTISDHDEVEGALELRRYRLKKGHEDVIVGGEYTVAIEPRCFDQTIHVNCVGLDYSNGATSPLPDHKVRTLNRKLLRQRECGEKEFIKFCKGEGVPYVKSHIALQCTPKKPLSGEQLYRLMEGEDKIELNGDSQLENLIELDIAQRNKLAICCGTDAHTKERLGNQFTVAWKLNSEGEPTPVETPAELVDAFINNNIGMGSTHSLPENITNPSLADIVFYQFNGTTKNLQRDTMRGSVDYVTYEWGWRKAIFLGIFVLPVALFNVPLVLPDFTAWGLGFGGGALVLGLSGTALFYKGIPATERQGDRKRAKKLYGGINEYIAHLETESQREGIIELKDQIEKLNGQIEDHHIETQEIYRHHANKELPILNPKLKGFTKLARWFVNLYCGENKEDLVDTSAFTQPIEQEPTEE